MHKAITLQVGRNQSDCATILGLQTQCHGLSYFNHWFMVTQGGVTAPRLFNTVSAKIRIASDRSVCSHPRLMHGPTHTNTTS